MADINKNINITGDSGDAQEAIDALGQKFDQSKSKATEFTQVLESEVEVQKKVKTEVDKSTQAHRVNADEVTKNGGAIAILDQLTGGMASQFKNAYEASGLFNASLGKMKTALIATGIGALVVALGLIVAYWDQIVGFIDGSSRAMEAQIELQKEQVQLAEDRLQEIKDSRNTLILQGNTEREITEELRRQVQTVLELRIGELELSKIRAQTALEQSKRTQKYIKEAINFISIPLTLTLRSIDLINKALGKSSNLFEQYQDTVSSWVVDPDEVADENKKSIEEQEKMITKLTNERDGYTLKLQDMDNQIAQKRRDNMVKEAEAHQKMLEEIEKLENDYLTSQLSEQTQELNAVEDKYFKLIEYAKEHNQDLTVLEEARLSEIDEINQKYIDKERVLQQGLLDVKKEFELKLSESRGEDTSGERTDMEEEDALANIDKMVADGVLGVEMVEQAKDAIRDYYNEVRRAKEVERDELEFQEDFEKDGLRFQERLDLLDERRQAILDNENLTEEERTRLLKENSDARVAIEQAAADSRMAILGAVSNSLSSFSKLVGEQTAAGKAAAIAAATIETYQSAVSSYNSLSGIPIVGPALGAVAAGLAVATGLANIKKIVSTKVPGQSGPGGKVPTAPDIPQANFNIIGQDSNNQLGQTINEQTQEPVKAYVVSGEVSSQQELDRNRNQTATFL